MRVFSFIVAISRTLLQITRPIIPNAHTVSTRSICPSMPLRATKSSSASATGYVCLVLSFDPLASILQLLTVAVLNIFP